MEAELEWTKTASGWSLSVARQPLARIITRKNRGEVAYELQLEKGFKDDPEWQSHGAQHGNLSNAKDELEYWARHHAVPQIKAERKELYAQIVWSAGQTRAARRDLSGRVAA